MKLMKSVRGKLTFYFVIILGLILSVFSILLYNIFASQSRNEIDQAMLTLASSVRSEILSDGIQEGIFDELKESYIPFSKPKLQTIEILNDSAGLILKSRSGLNINSFIDKKLILESLKTNNIFKNINTLSNDSGMKGYEYRVLIYPMHHDQLKYIIIVGIPLSDLENKLSDFRLSLFISIPLFMMLSSILGWFLTKSAYAPVNEMIRNARSITSSNLEKRLQVNDSGDEISELAKTLNGMTERLQNSFQTLKQFTSDASHELRTPLTILKGEIEVTLSRQRSSDEYEKTLRNNLVETERLQKIVDGLLTLSQLESGKVSISKEEIDIKDLLTEAVSKINILAGEKNIRIILNLEVNESSSDNILFFGDRNLLLNVFINLLDNSVKYSHQGSKIICTEKTDVSNKIISVTITDSGIGISAENLKTVFDRFTRADLSRSSTHNTGAGLGLAIAKAVIESHDGSISAASILGEGSSFTVTLPLTLK